MAITMKELLTNKDSKPEYKLEGVKRPVTVQDVVAGKVLFSGYDYQDKAKDGKMAVVDFIKAASKIVEIDVENQENVEESQDLNDIANDLDAETTVFEQEQASESTEADEVGENHAETEIVDSSPVSDGQKEVTVDMLDVGQRFILSDVVGEVEILKITKGGKLSYLSVAELSLDPKDRPDPIVLKKEEFCTAINTYISGKKNTPETKEAPVIKAKKEIEAELTVKKSSDELQVDLTPSEVLIYHEKLAGLLKDKKQKESEKKSFVKQISGEIDKMQSEIELLTDAVNSKKEFRPVPISIEYHWKKNKRLTIRLDTGVIISETAIPKHELQNTFIDD